MKYQIQTTVYVKCTLDSSEAIMFSKGGRHSLTFTPDQIPNCNLIQIDFQMERNEQGRFDHITKSAAEAIIRREEEEEDVDESKSS